MKGILPKLLAKENITIQHGNYHTAWFDIKDRVLGLPMWKDMGKDVYDLLIGHEVGHALETPYEGWHDNPENLEGCPRSYINVVEDARIERKVKSRYPGLVRSFEKGYAQLWDNEFFGAPNELPSWDEVKLIDKINLEAKVGAHLDVPFNPEEQVFMDRAMTTESFDEVVQLVRDILAYTQENQPELLQPPEPEESDSNDIPNDGDEDDMPQGHDDMMPSESSQEDEAQTEGEGQTEDGEEAEKETNSVNNDSTDGQGNEETTAASHGGDSDESITDKNFRANEDKLIEDASLDGRLIVGNQIDKDMLKDIFIPYKKIEAGRAPLGTSRWSKEEWESHDIQSFNEVEFVSYMKDVKRSVNYAVKEFEQRKAAFRYTRAQTAKTGSLDVNKLWSYKTNEDIFSRVTKLADAKNHGMFMLIDFSGSMSGVMDRVIDQLIHLVVFCKTVNIPFDVYGFTTGNPNFKENKRDSYKEGQVHHEGLALCQQISSELGKKDYTEALKFLFHRKNQEASWRGMRICEYGSPYEDWGSTPLNTSLVAIHDKLFNMISSKGIDNMNLVVLSDGDTNQLRISNDIPEKFASTATNNGASMWAADYRIRMGKGIVESQRSGVQMTKEMLNYYRKFGITTLGFFLANDRYAYNYKLSDVCYDKNNHDRYENEEFTKDAHKQNTKNKCVIYNDTLGYDEFYIVQTFNKSVMNIENEDFEVQEDATKAQITTAFKKHSKGKKLNKTLLTNFGKAVAV